MEEHETVRARLTAALERVGVVVDSDIDDASLRDFVPDSLGLVAALVEIEDEFGISLPDKIFMQGALESFAGLTRAIAEAVDGSDGINPSRQLDDMSQDG